MDTALATRIENFFAAYAAATLKGDSRDVGGAYAMTYIEAAPAGVQAFTVGDAYRHALDGKFAAMKKIGLTAATVTVVDMAPIAPRHVLVNAAWRLRFAPQGKSAAAASFNISYVLRDQDDELKILLAVSHEDEQRALEQLDLE